MKPRPHQTEAVAAIVAGFRNYDRGQVHMACGSGKTLVGLLAAGAIGAQRIVVFLPSLGLVRQTIDAYDEAVRWPEWRALAVCSQREILTDGAPCPVTGERGAIEEFLSSAGVTVVFATYHSADRLAGLAFDLGLFDEAHRTAGESPDRLFSFALSVDAIAIRKRLFMTATPRHMPDTAEETEFAYSMHDEEAFGPVFYQLPLRAAIEQGLVCDYRVVVSVKLQDAVEEHPRAAAQAAIVDAMDRHGLQKAISFHHRIVDAARFVENPTIFSSIRTLHINGDQSMSDRGLVLDAFRDAHRALLSNARCLSEGIDVPAVDLVAFVDRKESAAAIVQGLGRCIRKAPGKSRGYVLLPLLLNRDELVDDDVLKRRRFRGLVGVLRALQENDDMVAGSFKRYRKALVASEKPPLLSHIEVTVLDEPALSPAQVQRIVDSVTTRIVTSLAPREWTTEYRKKLLLDRARAGGQRPRHTADPVEGTLANSLSRYAIREHSRQYDAVFAAAIREARPDWFVQSTRKRELLETARQGGLRPTKSDRKRYDMLWKYLTPSSKVYDPLFVEELHAIAPHWLVQPQRCDDASRKDRLLDRAAKGKRLPPNRDGVGRALRAFVDPHSEYFDPVFTERLRALCPDGLRRMENLAALRRRPYEPKRPGYKPTDILRDAVRARRRAQGR